MPIGIHDAYMYCTTIHPNRKPLVTAAHLLNLFVLQIHFLSEVVSKLYLFVAPIAMANSVIIKIGSYEIQ